MTLKPRHPTPKKQARRQLLIDEDDEDVDAALSVDINESSQPDQTGPVASVNPAFMQAGEQRMPAAEQGSEPGVEQDHQPDKPQQPSLGDVKSHDAHAQPIPAPDEHAAPPADDAGPKIEDGQIQSDLAELPKKHAPEGQSSEAKLADASEAGMSSVAEGPSGTLADPQEKAESDDEAHPGRTSRGKGRRSRSTRGRGEASCLMPGSLIFQA